MCGGGGVGRGGWDGGGEEGVERGEEGVERGGGGSGEGGVSLISYTLSPSIEAGARRRPQHKFSSPQ